MPDHLLLHPKSFGQIEIHTRKYILDMYLCTKYILEIHTTQN